MESRDPAVFGRNVRAFRALRGWGVRELAARSDLSTKTIVKIEKGELCTSKTEQKIAAGFGTYLGRLWDPNLLSDEPQRVIRSTEGRWFFAAIEDADKYYQRLVKSQPELAEERLRSDPDEIQDEAERHRLGHAGLSRAFVRTMGGGLATGYYQYNQAEMFSKDITPPDGFGYTYVCFVLRGDLRMEIRGKTFELHGGDSMVFDGGTYYSFEPLHPLSPSEPPPMMQFVCLGVLALPKP
jgi:transcriptional regulator with XRE-family HTH domain